MDDFTTLGKIVLALLVLGIACLILWRYLD